MHRCLAVFPTLCGFSPAAAALASLRGALEPANGVLASGKLPSMHFMEDSAVVHGWSLPLRRDRERLVYDQGLQSQESTESLRNRGGRETSKLREVVAERALASSTPIFGSFLGWSWLAAVGFGWLGREVEEGNASWVAGERGRQEGWLFLRRSRRWQGSCADLTIYVKEEGSSGMQRGWRHGEKKRKAGRSHPTEGQACPAEAEQHGIDSLAVTFLCCDTMMVVLRMVLLEDSASLCCIVRPGLVAALLAEWYLQMKGQYPTLGTGQRG